MIYGEVINPAKIANAFNQYFTVLEEQLSEDIPRQIQLQKVLHAPLKGNCTKKKHLLEHFHKEAKKLRQSSFKLIKFRSEMA